MNTREWEVRDDIRGNSTGIYLTLNVRTKGTIMAPVTVKWSTRRDRMACLTCNTADECPHSRFMRAYVETHPEIRTTHQEKKTA